jgi:hypothetical protein
MASPSSGYEAPQTKTRTRAEIEPDTVSINLRVPRDEALKLLSAIGEAATIGLTIIEMDVRAVEAPLAE